MAKQRHKGTNSRAGRARSPKLTSKQLNSLIFQPWFVPRETFLTIAKLVPREYLLKMRDYFDRYGCMRCRSRSRPYGRNGMCGRCATEIGRRLRRCWKRRLKLLNQQAGQREVKHILANAKTARKLLADLVVPTREPAKSTQRIHPARNPASELLPLAR